MRKGRNDKGRSRGTDGSTSLALDRLEAFCCAQTIRIDQTLRARYGRASGLGQRNFLMPQNDDHIRGRMVDLDVELRGQCSGFGEGAKRVI